MSDAAPAFPSRCPAPDKRISSNPPQPREQKLFSDICDIVRPEQILEIGSWMGSSAIAWATSAKRHHPQAQVFCVDTWLGSPEHYLWESSGEWSRGSLALTERGPDFFDDFLANIHAQELADSILPLRASSSSALPYLKKLESRFDVIYIDGAHDSHSVFQDLHQSLSLLSEEGFVCGDDFQWKSVQMGLKLLALVMRRERLHILTSGNSFIILHGQSLDYEHRLNERGYTRWKALTASELLNPFRFIKTLFVSLLF